MHYCVIMKKCYVNPNRSTVSLYGLLCKPHTHTHTGEHSTHTAGRWPSPGCSSSGSGTDAGAPVWPVGNRRLLHQDWMASRWWSPSLSLRPIQCQITFLSHVSTDSEYTGPTRSLPPPVHTNTSILSHPQPAPAWSSAPAPCRPAEP
jgi:hypothetical protein